MDLRRTKAIIEAVLMVADSSVTPGKLVSLIDGITGREVRNAVDALKREYAESDRAFTVVEVAGGYRISTLKEYAPWVKKLQRDRIPTKLSQAALEALAIVAFRQPVIRSEIENIRGVNSGGVLRTLMERNLIRIAGRSDGVGRPLLYGTTKEFLSYFGLKSIADLPKPKELEELLKEGEQKFLQNQTEQISGESWGRIEAEVR